MADHVYIRGEGGTVFKLDLPLHETIVEKLDKGLVHLVDKDGKLVDDKSAGWSKSAPADKPIDDMTGVELKAYAAEHEIDLGEAKLKADVLEVVQKAVAERTAAAAASGGNAGDE